MTETPDADKKQVCRRVRDRLPELLVDSHGIPGREALLKHLEICPDCGKERDSLVRTIEQLADRQIRDPGEAFWRSLRSSVHERIDRDRHRPSRFFIPKPGAAALLSASVVLLFLALWWIFPGRRSEAPGGACLAMIEMEAQQSLNDLGRDRPGDENLVEDVLDTNTPPISTSEQLLTRLNDAQLERLAKRLEDLMG